MNDISQSAVVTAIAASSRTAEAVGHLYDAVCDAPGVQNARQRRRLLGLGKHLAGDPNAADLDRLAIDLMLGFIGIGGVVSLDDRMNSVHYLAQEGLARPAPESCRPLSSLDDISLCLALDAAALVRANIELAFSAANLDMAYEWAKEGDPDGERALAIRLTMDTHTPVGIALGATRIALRVFLNGYRSQPLLTGVSSERVAAGYDAMIVAAYSDVLRMVAATRTAIETLTPDPDLGPEASYLAGEIAQIAINTEELNEASTSVLRSIAKDASIVADLAAGTAEAYEVARKAIPL